MMAPWKGRGLSLTQKMRSTSRLRLQRKVSRTEPWTSKELSQDDFFDVPYDAITRIADLKAEGKHWKGSAGSVTKQRLRLPSCPQLGGAGKAIWGLTAAPLAL